MSTYHCGDREGIYYYAFDKPGEGEGEGDGYKHGDGVPWGSGYGDGWGTGVGADIDGGGTYIFDEPHEHYEPELQNLIIRLSTHELFNWRT